VLTTFITVLAWIYAVAYFGWAGLVFTLCMFTPRAKLTVKTAPMLIGFVALAWIITTFVS
jgi:hypothetical protein